MILYKVNQYNHEIKEVEVTRYTDINIWVYSELINKDVKTLRNTKYEKHFETFEEAKQHLINRYESRIEGNKKAIIDNEKLLELVKNLKPE